MIRDRLRDVPKMSIELHPRPASIASPDWKLSDSFVRGSPRPSDGQRIWATQRPLSMSGLLFPPEEIDRIARYKLYYSCSVVAHLLGGLRFGGFLQQMGHHCS